MKLRIIVEPRRYSETDLRSAIRQARESAITEIAGRLEARLRGLHLCPPWVRDLVSEEFERHRKALKE